MSKQFVAVLIAILVGLGGIFWLTGGKESGSSNTGSTNSSALSNHVTGENKKKVTLVEYGDFQCPACASYYPLLKEVKEKYKEDIQFQFRNFPLQQIHQNARASSRAAEAASKQGKFWEMHDALYEGQKSWETVSDPVSVFEGYASQIGLDVEKFKVDYASKEANDTINADVAEGEKIGVNSTPSFFLQGKKLEEAPRDVEGFSKLIDEAIAATQKN